MNFSLPLLSLRIRVLRDDSILGRPSCHVRVVSDTVLGPLVYSKELGALFGELLHSELTHSNPVNSGTVVRTVVYVTVIKPLVGPGLKKCPRLDSVWQSDDLPCDKRWSARCTHGL